MWMSRIHRQLALSSNGRVLAESIPEISGSPGEAGDVTGKNSSFWPLKCWDFRPT
jgi:hypothetical protein